VCVSVLQRDVVRCSIMQYAAMRDRVLYVLRYEKGMSMCCSVLQNVAV